VTPGTHRCRLAGHLSEADVVPLSEAQNPRRRALEILYLQPVSQLFGLGLQHGTADGHFGQSLFFEPRQHGFFKVLVLGGDEQLFRPKRSRFHHRFQRIPSGPYGRNRRRRGSEFLSDRAAFLAVFQPSDYTDFLVQRDLTTRHDRKFSHY